VVVVDPGVDVDGTGGSRSIADQVVKEIVDGGGSAVACTESVANIEPAFKSRAPQLTFEEDGEWWVCDGKRLQTGFGFSGSQTGMRFETPGNMTAGDLFENVRPGGYIPEEQIKDMDLDGIDVSIIYPSLGLQLFRVPENELLNAVFRTYNDWVADFCKASPKRLAGIAMINVDLIDEAVQELERCKMMGMIGVMIPVYPLEGHRYNSPEYEPLWEAANRLEMPISLHAATNRVGSGEGEPDGGRRISLVINSSHYALMSITDLIFAGVFERYPKLQVGSVEHEIAWAAHMIERMDWNYKQREAAQGSYRFQEDMLPGDYFRKNVFIGFQEDGLGIRLRDYIGLETLQWGSDYPHQESTFPRSRQILEEILSDCTEREKTMIAGGNAARVYKL
ncbi:amidohydrolase, partial [SAR202 cluster bacterium AD-804-J14_MRT_500m]|nr:amidohydrolase [SAR202 cluster bacterium AD-804-J14_MRT_500m]